MALPELDPKDRGSAPPLQSTEGADNVLAATPFRQKGRKYMSKRSGQTGQVFLRNDRWVGRFYVDVPGDSKRKRRALVLGMKQELTRSEAKRKLLDIIMQEGVNTPTHLERSLRPPTTFADVADAWEIEATSAVEGKQQVHGTKAHREVSASIFRPDGSGRNQDRNR